MMFGITGFEDVILRTAAVIVAIGGMVVAVRTVYVYVLRPLRDIAAAMPVLLDIAHQFHPNDGSSLRDRVDTISIRLENMEQQLEALIVEGERIRGDV
jgi:hypothetical protein